MTRAAIYARVSTDDQNCEIQLTDLRRWCLAMGLQDPVEFADEGVSGIRDNRPRLDELRRRMKLGEFQVVVATKLDRIGRSVQMILRFWDDADAARVRVVLLDQGIDTSTPAGRLQRTMLAAIAEFERELIMERTLAGIQRARNLRKRFGRPRTIPDDLRALVVERARSGWKPRDISRDLKIKESTVRTLIRRGNGCIQSPPRESAGSGSTVDSSRLNLPNLNDGGDK